MDSYPAPAHALVEAMREAAAADPARAVAFQGAPGANSHRAALEWAPAGQPLPCFAFEDALDAVKDGRAGCAIIPIENSQHGRVADIHFLLPESGPGPVVSDPRYPYISFYRYQANPRPSFRVADLNNIILQPSTKDALRKANERALSGQIIAVPKEAANATPPIKTILDIANSPQVQAQAPGRAPSRPILPNR